MSLSNNLILSGDCITSGAEVPLVSVFIVTWNNVKELALCLNSLSQLSYPKDRLEMVLLDNGSTDGTGSQMSKFFNQRGFEGWRRIVFRQSDRNLGAFGGRCEALKFVDSGADFILCLDDDVELASDALTLLVRAAEDPKTGIVGGRIVFEDAPDEIASAAGYLNRWLGTYYQRIPTLRSQCDFVYSCGCLLKRSVTEKVGGFDREFFTAHGDVDLCLKMQRNGYLVVYEPSAVIRHKIARNGARNPERIYYLYRNKILILRRYLPFWWKPVVLAIYFIVWPPKILLESVKYHKGISLPEIRAIFLALLDTFLGRYGKAKWYR